MKKVKFFLFPTTVLIALLATLFVVTHENTLVFHPKGVIAQKELDLIITNVALMLIPIAPTFILLLVVAWVYRSKNSETNFRPEIEFGVFKKILLWLFPSIIVAIMALITWNATHKLDPYRPLDSKVKPMTIQVVALDWKWLFIYPEEEIASLNFVQFPEKTPIRFELAADGSPMNAFWIPSLSGQIYCMTGMITLLHIMADGPGTYFGKAAEINGKGYAKMTFIAKSTSKPDFESWVSNVKSQSQPLTLDAYNELIAPSIVGREILYSNVEKDLFNTIVMKYMHPPKKT